MRSGPQSPGWIIPDAPTEVGGAVTSVEEDLNIKGLKEKGKSKGLHRGIHGASWGRFYSYLAYRAESAGAEPVKVDPRNTSQIS
ncbi:MAG TPA: IS200/IS605 family accessory protein TnpB-related protein [Candidatus Methanoculleus thermohydrogenotrophicum]|jgi:putative transposase|nr:IS200/IS605 family accessory protein TnpB-related protein [Candidatus Methanoculleus thermohydrogenotrophicum]HOB17142.1 IS200/IS605 family accessory protein TnpB-related protein [Candidatus Methanoculleus thermohydrogenotrophicum]HPZ37221.1 IS200/IS605 family accessory protein TnpB-related protein [Candidatus Methanoculleus thermohydrogenotrophicum]HQC90565.1 IS200/IS605 family accessory protein TnpB-related protein [Candidatus Methanoculleus thermohydrogenotrophicum]